LTSSTSKENLMTLDPTARKRILVVANNTCPCESLHQEIRSRSGDGNSEVLIVAPALNKRIRHYVSDTGEAVAEAELRLARAVESLDASGLEASGVVGDADPVQAIEDEVERFPPDEIILSTWPPEHSNWLEKDLVEKARERFDAPVTHLVSNYGLEAAT